uniref:Uncharacterized protein n=1 Tax=Eucampia antarctica TaxID=49252 RepID=A0A7S2R7F6_9STRA|mmetsp:Transcript_18126/g.17501  ORF Transcript_18126/g.17501 Transcript_18126/m.17501 type:complete len:415 (+) Transcript_18126:14-1258(+)
MTAPKRNVFVTGNKRGQTKANPYKESSFTLSSFHRLAIFVLTALLVLFLFIGNGGYGDMNLRSRSSAIGVTKNDLGEFVIPRLTPQVLTIGSYKVFYMLPYNTKKSGIKGILVHFHACGHRGADLFILPEDRIIVHEALERGLAVVSMNSLNESTGCWQTIDGNDITKPKFDDAKTLAKENTIYEWKKLVGMERNNDIPIMVMGASNFVFYAWKAMKVHAVASYVMGFGGRMGGFFEKDADRKHDEPEYELPNAVIFIYLAESDAGSDLGFYTDWLRYWVGITSKLIDVKPHTFTAQTCDRTIPELGYIKCNQLIQFIDKNYPHLFEKKDGSSYTPAFKHEDWKHALLQSGLLVPDNNNFGKNIPTLSFEGHSWIYESVVEELNTVVGMNEMISAGKEEVLDFLMCHSEIGPCS